MSMEELIGKKIAVFYDDGTSVSRKDGIVTSVTTDFLNLKVNNKELVIPKSRIVRIELDG